jgi:YD repeat-containing protein
LLRQARSTRKGTSLHQVARLSESLGMSYQMAYRKPGDAALLTPAVAHWRVGHYACLFQEKDGLYSVADDTAETTRNQIRMTREVVNLEASGYFLVPAGPLPDGWRKVSPSEGDTVWGRGDPGTARDPGALTSRDVKAPTKKCSCSCGMTTFSVHAMLVSLSLEDVPLGTSSAAYALQFPVNYAQRESQAPAVYDFSNFGSKWGSPWISWVEDYRAGGWISGIQLHWLGGGFENFDGKYVTANDPAGNVTERSVYSHSVITVIPSVGYVRDLPDGSKETYTKNIGNRWFLTSKSDAQGNTISLQYDNLSRLSSITDSAGRVMVMGYQLASDPLKITQVTDPFGRSALFGYTNGLLTSVTDTLGLVSSYQYGANDFIQSLTTPYGVTTFTHTDSLMDYSVGNSRVVTATDPAGRNYRVESRNDAPGIPTFEAVAPVGMPLNNGYLNFRNTFVWEPQQLGGTLDYTKATILHFMHGNYQWLVGGTRISGGPGRVLESYKKPLERRVWFTYPNINNQYATSNLPTQVGHVEEDGSTHLDQYQYNGLAQMTQHTDPMGRIFDYQRAANDIDLLSVSTGGQTLFSATYDNQHNIKTLTTASGGTSLYSYDSRGLLQSSTNELGETTTYGHTPTGNLNSIQSPLNATTTFGYNAQEQLSSATDSEGYTVTASHDGADRPTGVTYPDSTTETITYDRLDVASTKDRKDRVTQLHHDGLRRLDQVTDANNGATLLGYGLEDAPISLTDPA